MRGGEQGKTLENGHWSWSPLLTAMGLCYIPAVPSGNFPGQFTSPWLIDQARVDGWHRPLYLYYSLA